MNKTICKGVKITKGKYSVFYKILYYFQIITMKKYHLQYKDKKNIYKITHEKLIH